MRFAGCRADRADPGRGDEGAETSDAHASRLLGPGVGRPALVRKAGWARLEPPLLLLLSCQLGLLVTRPVAVSVSTAAAAIVSAGSALFGSRLVVACFISVSPAG